MLTTQHGRFTIHKIHMSMICSLGKTDLACHKERPTIVQPSLCRQVPMQPNVMLGSFIMPNVLIGPPLRRRDWWGSTQRARHVISGPRRVGMRKEAYSTRSQF